MRLKKKLKVALFTFLAIAGVAMTSGIIYLESGSFANEVKKMISERSPQKFGVVGDFSNLKLYFFPPGIGIASPKIKISKDNITQIPLDGEIEAKELRVSFAPIQMFSGVLQVSEVDVNSGSIQGILYADAFTQKPKKKKNASHLSWQDLFELQINGFRLEDTYLNLTTKLPGVKQEDLVTELVVKNLLIKKSRVDNRDGFISSATVNAVRVIPPASMNIPIKEANQLQWDVELNDKGLKLNPFIADLSGIRFQLEGQVDGNLLDAHADPIVNAAAEIHSDLGTFFLANLNNDQWSGQVDGHAKISARLRDPVDTLKAQFSVTGHGLRWKQVTANDLKGEGDLDLKLKKISLKSLEVIDDGKLKMTSTDIPFRFDEPFQANVELENANIRWLGGIVAKSVAPLEGKITGKIRAEFTGEKKSWKLKTENDFRVDQFALKTKVDILRPVLPVKLHGGMDVTPRGIDFRDFRVGLNKTQLDVTGGVHSGAEGFALEGKGAIDLAEFDKIAGSEIRGEGDIDVNVHGPASGVILDFTTKLKEASYLGLHFGNVDGKITYDDSIYELRFSDLHANYKNTFYTLDQGFIDLSGSDDINLPFDIHSGKIEDISEILEKLTKNISWFPKSLHGEMHGDVKIGGKISAPKMKIVGNIEGSDWIWVGERARRVKMQVGFDEGVYFARNVAITKTSGVLKGDIEYHDANDSLKWNFSTENMSFLDVDFLDRLELPAKSKIDLQTEGEGPLNHLKSKSQAKFYGTEFKGEYFEPSNLTLEIGESTLRANLSVFGSKLSSQLKYALIPKQPSSFKLDLNDFDFSPALLVLNPKLLDDPDLVGDISGHVQLDFLSTQSEFARGNIQVKSYKLGKTGFLLTLADPVDVPVQLGYFHFPPSRLKFGNSELVMGGEGKRGEVDFSLKGQADLAIAELLSSSVAKATGKADTDIRIKGPLKSLSVNGDIEISNARILMKWMQSPLEALDATIRFHQGLIEIESLEAYLGEEPFSLNGKIQTFTDRFPEMDLHAQFDDNKIKMFPLDFIQVRGSASLSGSEPPYVISGNLEVPQALWKRSFSASSSGPTSRGDRFLPIDQEKQSASNLFKLDLNANAPQGFNVKNDILDAEFKGKVKVIGPPDNPKLMGSAQLVQGKVLFKDKPFILESVKVDFDDPFQLNPKFSASAVSDVNQYKIRVIAYGSANSWKAEFSSTPFLAESDIVSLLASGYTTADNTRYNNKDRSYVSQGEAASLILHSMDFSKDVQNKTGFQFDVEEAVDSTYATSIFRPTNLSDNQASPKVVLKRQLGRNMFFSLGSTVGVGSENQKEVNAEYKLTPGVSALGVWNDTEEVGSTGTQTSFGLDLKFNKRFK
jgi:translocation and assembly module TamB